MGMGMMFPLGPNVPAPIEHINAMSLQAGAAAFAARKHDHAPYRGNPNSYIDIGRQVRLAQAASGVSHFNTQTRRPTPEHLVGRTRQSTFTPTAPPVVAVANADQARPSVGLSQFFDVEDRLVWPSDAPASGDLADRRADSDAAALAVLKELRVDGSAPIESAADARARLLDYGRPALQSIRASSSPAVAEGFHAFLLSLYDAIGAAATGP
jgi:hypothetical protein